jgi:hypothetical protein
MNFINSCHNGIVRSIVANLGSNLIYYYPFDMSGGVSGSIYGCYSPNYASGYAVMDASFQNAAVLNNALAYLKDGSGSLFLNGALVPAPYYSLPSFNLNNSSFTIAFWLYSISNKQFARIFDFATTNTFTNGDANTSIYCAVGTGTKTLMFDVSKNVSGTNSGINTYQSTIDQTWKHFVWSYTPSNPLLYVDGVLQSYLDQPVSWFDANDTSTVDTTIDANNIIWKSITGTDYMKYSKGNTIYNSASTYKSFSYNPFTPPYGSRQAAINTVGSIFVVASISNSEGTRYGPISGGTWNTASNYGWATTYEILQLTYDSYPQSNPKCTRIATDLSGIIYLNGSIASYVLDSIQYTPNLYELIIHNPFTLKYVIGSGTQYAFNGAVYEAVIYPNTLTTTQRQNIEGYLAKKWGFQSSLPTGHPWKTATIPASITPLAYDTPKYTNPSYNYSTSFVGPPTQQNYYGRMGKSFYALDPSFNGYIDDFRMYNIALNQTQVTTIYNASTQTLPIITSIVTASNTSVNVYFTAPTYGTTNQYLVSAVVDSSNTVVTAMSNGPTSPILVTGLTPGVLYHFTMNAVGNYSYMTSNKVPYAIIVSAIMNGNSLTPTNVTSGGIAYKLYTFTNTSGTNSISFYPTVNTAKQIQFSIFLVGGGGGGGNQHYNYPYNGYAIGGGGGGGGVLEVTNINLTSNTTFNITVGNGGVGTNYGSTTYTSSDYLNYISDQILPNSIVETDGGYTMFSNADSGGNVIYVAGGGGYGYGDNMKASSGNYGGSGGGGACGQINPNGQTNSIPQISNGATKSLTPYNTSSNGVKSNNGGTTNSGYFTSSGGGGAGGIPTAVTNVTGGVGGNGIAPTNAYFGTKLYGGGGSGIMSMISTTPLPIPYNTPLGGGGRGASATYDTGVLLDYATSGTNGTGGGGGGGAVCINSIHYPAGSGGSGICMVAIPASYFT